MIPVPCESRIERVVVYARGAVVTRTVTLPEALPEGPVEIRLGGVTARADGSSVRALARGEREVTALEARIVLPPGPASPGALAERVRALQLDLERLRAEHASLAERRSALRDLSFDPGRRRAARHVEPASRFADALAVDTLARAELGRIDRRVQEALEALEAQERALAAATIAAAQGTHAELAGPAAPELSVLVRLGGGGSVESLSIEYVVRSARWWPAYTARFSAAATKVALTLDAFVAQASGEDWAGVRLSLSTADLAQDARLPELRSLRFGRAQPAPRRGYRPPPPGLDAMFEGHDRAIAQAAPRRARAAIPAPKLQTRAPSHGGEKMKKLAPMDADLRASFDEVEGGDGGGAIYRGGPQGRALGAAMPEMIPNMAEGHPPPPKSGGLFGGLLSSSAAAKPAMAPGGGGFAQQIEAAAPEPEPQAIEPGEGWLDFDALVLREPTGGADRGKLARDPGPRVGVGPSTVAMPGPPLTHDPLEGRGRFDHRYDAEATADVPASGRPHRVGVASAEGPSTPRFVAVPREVAEVFREAEIQNPFGAPLLSGPVDVFLDGALLTTAPLSFVDRAGWIHLGLGVEERLRVARNARVEESTAGLLGGSAVVDHAITVDLASSLGRKVTVEVLERVPVSDDKDVEVKTTYTRPDPERYTQADRGPPLRKGLRFAVDVPAGGKAKIELGYRVTLPAKNEIVGGNRRE